LIIALVIGAISSSLIPIVTWTLWTVLCLIGIFFFDASRSKKYNFIFYTLSRAFTFRYYFFHIFESVKHKNLSGFTRAMSFSPQQTKYILKRETNRIWIILLAFVVSVIVTALRGIVFGKCN